jgi:multiple antibiotic resistance protein
MIALFLSAFVTLFLVIDPPGCAPIFAGLTKNATAPHRRAMAIRSTLVASAVLLMFALVGEALLQQLGISLDAFRIAGGIMLFLIALEMVFEKRTQRREHRAAEVDPSYEDISIFPMAIPMIAGPGAIATIMLLVGRSNGIAETLAVLAALAATMILMLLSLLAAGAIMRVLGPKLEAMITRMLGVILAALATQFVIDGVKASFS